MNRVEIKEAAKAKIRGNKWNLIWPVLLISICVSFLSAFFTPKIDINNLKSIADLKMTPVQTIGTTIISLVSGILTTCYLKYVIDFVRTGKFNANVILKTFKEKWLNIFVVTLIMSVLIAIGFALLVIPGIILALAYAFAEFIVIDSNTAPIDALKKSRMMMKGYKGNYFVFWLSFFGWFLLIVPTLGLIMIWLFPYMMVANVMYYEKLKQKAGK